MSKIVEYSKELIKRGNERIEEVAELEKKGKYEAAEKKLLQGAEDLLTVGKTTSKVMEQELKGLVADAKNLEKCLKGIEETGEIGKQILRKLGYNV